MAEIVAKYEVGATTPALCAEYGVSKGGLLKLLRDAGVEMRCQPLDGAELETAIDLYRQGRSIAAIADRFGLSYNRVLQAFIRAGVERRPRGGSVSRN